MRRFQAAPTLMSIKIMTTLTFNVTSNIADKSQSAKRGFADSIETFWRTARDNRRIDSLFSAADKLANADMPGMSMAEIQIEINGVRAERRPTSDMAMGQGMCA